MKISAYVLGAFVCAIAIAVSHHAIAACSNDCDDHGCYKNTANNCFKNSPAGCNGPQLNAVNPTGGNCSVNGTPNSGTIYEYQTCGINCGSTPSTASNCAGFTTPACVPCTPVYCTGDEG